MNRDLLWRFNSAGFAFFFLGVILIGKTISIQLSPIAPRFVEQKDLYSGALVEMIPPRGLIYDREGVLLAGNKTVYEVDIDLSAVVDPAAIAMATNGVLGLDYNKVLGLASTPDPGTPAYITLARDVPTEKVALLQEYMQQEKEAREQGQTGIPTLDGLTFTPYLIRSYPEKDLASSLLGFVSTEGQGYYGVEQYYQYLLAGEKQEVWLPNNPNLVGELPDIPPGANLVLTIDREIQAMVEEELDSAVKLYQATAGTVIVMDPQNGEILAIASTPRLDLNEYWRYEEIYPGTTPFNRGTSKAFEPGSVFKVFTMAAALDSKTVKPSTTFTDTGVFNIGGITIRNWNAGAWGTVDMTGCLQHSLNVCLAWVSSETGADTFYEYMKAFGFGRFTGVDIAGEATGRLKSPGDNDWSESDLGTNSFGQGISVTPIQIMQAATAITNEGKMVLPHVVLAFADNGNQFSIQPQAAGQPISAKTANTLKEMLAESLEKEASTALVEGYRVAGKTGTGEIPTEQGYTSAITNASFLGFGPVDDPKFLVYVWLEEPKASIWGSTTAAPTFSQITQRLVVLMNLPPDKVRLSLSSQ